LVEVQCLALHGVLSAGTACICQAARKKLHRVWKEVWHKLLLLYYCSFYDFSFLRDFSFLCCSVYVSAMSVLIWMLDEELIY